MGDISLTGVGQKKKNLIGTGRYGLHARIPMEDVPVVKKAKPLREGPAGLLKPNADIAKEVTK
jgi:hypothetical protein